MPKKVAKKVAKKVSKKVAYRGVDLPAVSTASIGGGMERGGGFFKIPDTMIGKAVAVRLLPPVGEMGGVPWVMHRLHYDNGPRSQGWEIPGEERRRAITCLNEHGNPGGCPVCLLREIAKHDGNLELEKRLTPKWQRYIQILDRSDEKVKIWTAPAAVIKAIQAILQSKAGDITHPEKGRDLMVTKSGDPRKWSTIEYQAMVDVERSPIGVPGWEADLTDLTNLVKILAPEEIIEILHHNLHSEVDVHAYLSE